jgi:tRNA(Ile)-lysidine synthase
MDVVLLDIAPILSKRQKYLVAVSGGADSIALLYLLLDSNIKNIVVCHLNHQLRGKSSQADARFVEKLCAKLNVRIISQSVDVKNLMLANKSSLETAARNARHDFFARCAKVEKCNRVILAHHADDQAETALWNLLRGSHGMKAMKASQTHKIGNQTLTFLRPLLSIRHHQLRSYLAKNNIQWREDSTNAQPLAARNRMRNEVIPLLENIMQRGINSAILRQISFTKDHDEITQWAIEQARLIDPQARLHIPALQKIPPALQKAAFHHYLINHSISEISYEMIEQCCRLLDNTLSPVINLPGNKILRRRAQRIFLND